MPRTFYRIVHTATKEGLPIEDFMSNKALDEEPPVNPEHLRLFDGISVYATEQQARNKATAFPRLGRFIAAVEVEDGAPVHVERTLPKSRGHYTLWGAPEEIRRRVVSVVPV
jgi:hypothetical protein